MKAGKTIISSAVILAFAAGAALGRPILKPQKYYGPIPKRSFSLRIGFLEGATNENMYDYIGSKRANPSIRSFPEDFANSVIIDGAYTLKLHPNFGVRAASSITFLRSKSHGHYVPQNQAPPLPIRDFERTFNVDLLSIAGDAIYYFSNAAVSEFQPYIGGGFSAWIPHAVYKENAVDKWAPADSLPDYSHQIADKTEWSFEAGIQGILGALYYATNTFAFTAEARYHIAQSRFPLKVNTPGGGLKDINFTVKYTGFVINFGVVKAF